MEKALAIFEREGEGERERERERTEREQRERELKEYVNHKTKRTIVCGSGLFLKTHLRVVSPIQPYRI